LRRNGFKGKEEELFILVLIELSLSSNVLGFVKSLVKDVSSLASCFLNGSVDGRRVLLEDRQDHLGVDDGSPVVLHGGHAPDHEQALAEPVEGDPPSNEVSKVLNHREGSKDDPVGEPLGVVALDSGLQSPDRAVRWVGKANGVGEELSSKSKSQPGSHKRTNAIGNIDPLNSSVVLQNFEGVANHALLVERFSQLVLEGGHGSRHS